MRYEPVNSWICGRVAMIKHAKDALIKMPGAPKGVTRHYVIEEVSPEAAEKGYKPGDIVIVRVGHDLLLWGKHKIWFETKEVMTFVRDIPLSEFTDIDGKPFLEAASA